MCRTVKLVFMRVICFVKFVIRDTISMTDFNVNYVLLISQTAKIVSYPNVSHVRQVTIWLPIGWNANQYNVMINKFMMD